MKVHHVSSAPLNGGAARAGLRLHCGLSQVNGLESLWLDAGGLPDVPSARQLVTSDGRSSIWTRVRRIRWRRELQNAFAGAKTPYTNPIGWGTPGAFQNFQLPEVWNLHWVSEFLDWENLLPWMAEQAPVVWTLHDLNPLMGVWHYMPVAGELQEQRHRAESNAIALKKQALARIPKERLMFVGPSEWIVDQCRQSPITAGFLAAQIPYGVDTEVFAPRDRRAFRSMFGIPDDVLVLGFAADSVSDPRKGMSQLESAITAVSSSFRVHVLTVGSGRAPVFKFSHSHLGPIQNDFLLSFFYSACDLFVCPSLQDNLPNTVLESMACGTPVVAYEAGGLPDMVRENISGNLATPVGDVASLASAISKLLAAPQKLSELRGHCRDLAVNEYPLAVQARNYVALYEQMIRQSA